MTAAVLAPGSLSPESAPLVTGAGTGIGRGIALPARPARRRGRRCRAAVRAARRDRRCSPARRSSRRRSTSGTARRCDAFCAGLDRLDLLVNNAGGQFLAPADEISDRGFAAVLDLNLTAVARLTELCRPSARRAAPSSSSRCPAPSGGFPGMSHSATARAAVVGLDPAPRRLLAGGAPSTASRPGRC